MTTQPSVASDQPSPTLQRELATWAAGAVLAAVVLFTATAIFVEWLNSSFDRPIDGSLLEGFRALAVEGFRGVSLSKHITTSATGVLLMWALGAVPGAAVGSAFRVIARAIHTQVTTA